MATDLRVKRTRYGYRIGEYNVCQTGRREWTMYHFPNGFEAIKAIFPTFRQAKTWAILFQK